MPHNRLHYLMCDIVYITIFPKITFNYCANVERIPFYPNRMLPEHLKHLSLIGISSIVTKHTNPK